MKRHGNLFQQICSMENLMLADAIGQTGKKNNPDIKIHNANSEANLMILQGMLLNKTFTTSQYQTRTIWEPKEREIFILPYYPDRIVQHAVMNVLEPYFVRMFTNDVNSCIKGRGVHRDGQAIRRCLLDVPNTQYCLKIDIRKFYPSVDHDVLKMLLRRKFKDQDLLWLLDDIIDSAPGLPIGNYLSQYLSNFYLTGLDHWLKEVKRVKYYFRYADDIAIFGSNKPDLHQLLADIREYLDTRLKLEVKGNYQVFPFDVCGLDRGGYRYYRHHTLMRKRIKQNFARAVARGAGREVIASYMGWAKYCNSKNLVNTLFRNEIQGLKYTN